MPPHEMKIKYNDLYDCMKAGHEQSIIKMNKLGREQTNEYKMYFKFVCFNNKNSNHIIRYFYKQMYFMIQQNYWK